MREFIVADLERCLGCHACEIACKQANRLAEGSRIIEVLQIGPGESNAQPGMRNVPAIGGGCTLCSGRSEGPACVETCPTRALSLCDSSTALRLLYGGACHQIVRFPRRDN